ncbi:peptidylprolyl isomerase [bacterium]|nr:MAG: peptidylprolyl isomerase [bacterium]
MNKKIVYVIIALVVLGVASWFIWGRSSDTTEEQSEQTQTENEQTAQTTGTESTPAEPCERTFNNSDINKVTVNSTDKFVTLSVEGFGDIKIEVDRAAAPKTSENFLKLAKSGFYDCLTFHRVADGFVIQGGDPNGDGTGGPGYTVPAEIKLPHLKYSVATARQGDNVNPNRESSGSQFYIALDALPMLDGQYTVFGKVVAGTDVVDKIGGVPIAPGPFGGGDGAPKEKVVIKKATVSDK